MCKFAILPNETRAYKRMPKPTPEIQTLDDLLALQNIIGCDMHIFLPRKNGQRLVSLLDP